MHKNKNVSIQIFLDLSCLHVRTTSHTKPNPDVLNITSKGIYLYSYHNLGILAVTNYAISMNINEIGKYKIKHTIS